MREERDQIIKGIAFEKELAANFRKKLEEGGIDGVEGIVKTVPEDMLAWADEELNKGNVAAVDGTNFPPLDLISGVFCQVGVGGMSYISGEPAINVQSITSNITEDTTAGEYFGELIAGKEKKLSKRDIAAAMQYWELEHCLEREEEWVFKDGNVISRELLISDVAIQFLRKNIRNVMHIIGIIKGSKSSKYRLFGRFLRPGEYMIIETLADFQKNAYIDKRRIDTSISYKLGTKALEFVVKESARVKRGVL